MIVAVVNGALTTDQTILDNKTAVSTYFVDAGLNTTDFLLDTVTNDAATVTTAKTAVDVVKVDNTAVALALTTGVDALTGSKASDTFTADILTVGATDSIIDASGTDNDTLNMTINNTVAATFKTTDVETINVTSLGGNTINMDLMTGVDALNTTGSTGTVTVAAAANAGMALGFAGSSTNNISATYTTDALSGTADKLMVNLSTATGVTAAVNAGFETAEVAVTGTSSLTLLTAPGVTAVTVSGTGALTIADNALANFTAVTVTDTAAISTGVMAGLKTFVATANTGGIVDADLTAATGLASNQMTGDTAGLSFLTGSGADNVAITDAATTNSTTVKLGAGADKLLLTKSGSASTYIFGEAGDDTIKIATGTDIDANDLIDGGAGTDTLIVADADAQTWVLRGIENVILTSAAIAANTINSSDTALAITAQVDGTAVNLATLTAGSTVTTEAATAAISTVGGAATTTTAGAVTVGFAAAEATSTINLATGVTGAIVLDKITAATLTIGAASLLGSDITLTSGVASLTVNATGALTGGTNADIISSDDALTTVAVTGTAALTLGTIGDAAGSILDSATITGVGAVEVGDIGLLSTKLSTVNVTSSGANVVLGTIGAVTNTDVLSVTASAKNAITVNTGDIESTKLGNISLTSTASTVAVGAIGSTATELGDITVSALGSVVSGLIGHATATIATAGTIAMTSTNGAVQLAAGGVKVTDTTGVTVNLSAKTFIDSDGAGTATLIENDAGDITSTLSGAAAAVVNYTVSGTTNAGSVNVTATTLTGGLISTILNDEIAGVGTSTISLGASSAAKVNTITLDGYTNKVTVNGSAGIDTVIDATDGNLQDGTTVVVNSSDTFSGSTGSADVISYAGHAHTDSTTLAQNEGAANGMAINLSSSTVTFYTGTTFTTAVSSAGTSTLAAGKAAQYDSGATGADAGEKAIITGGEMDTLSGFEKVIGTAASDYINVAATGMTVTGGAGADYIVAGAGVDTIVHGTSVAATDVTGVTATVIAGDTITFGSGLDVVIGFNSAGDLIDVTTPATVGTFIGETAATISELTTYVTSGDYNATTGVFTIAASGVGADTLIFENEGTAANDAIATMNNAMVLIGVVETSITTADFI